MFIHGFGRYISIKTSASDLRNNCISLVRRFRTTSFSHIRLSSGQTLQNIKIQGHTDHKKYSQPTSTIYKQFLSLPGIPLGTASVSVRKFPPLSPCLGCTSLGEDHKSENNNLGHIHNSTLQITIYIMGYIKTQTYQLGTTFTIILGHTGVFIRLFYVFLHVLQLDKFYNKFKVFKSSRIFFIFISLV